MPKLNVRIPSEFVTVQVFLSWSLEGAICEHVFCTIVSVEILIFCFKSFTFGMLFFSFSYRYIWGEGGSSVCLTDNERLTVKWKMEELSLAGFC